MFDFPSSKLAEVLMTRLTRELTAGGTLASEGLLGAVDQLVDSSAAPTDETGWLTLVYAARLMLGESIDDEQQAAVTRWMRAHARTIGPSVLERIGLKMRLAPLAADDLLALVHAGSEAGTHALVSAYESEAFRRVLAQAMNIAQPAPSIPNLTWSQTVLSEAKSELERHLPSLPAASIGRVLDVADALSLSIGSAVLEGAAQDLIAAWTGAGTRDGPRAPRRYVAAMAGGAAAWLEQEPPAASQINVLRGALIHSGLAEGIAQLPAAKFPVARSLVALGRDQPSETSRLAAFRSLVAGARLNWATIDRIAETMWADQHIADATLIEMIRLSPKPLKSPWMIHRLALAIENGDNSDKVQRLFDVADDYKVVGNDIRVAGPLGEAAHAVLLAYARIQDVLAPGGKLTSQAVEFAWVSALGLQRLPTELSTLSRYMLFLDGPALVHVVRLAGDRDGSGHDAPVLRMIYEGLSSSARENRRDPNLLYRAAEVFAAVCELPEPESGELIRCLRQFSSWTDEDILFVEALLRRSKRNRRLVNEWSEWAPKGLKSGFGNKLRGWKK